MRRVRTLSGFLERARKVAAAGAAATADVEEEIGKKADSLQLRVCGCAPCGYNLASFRRALRNHL